jgi:hypothetical protein
MEKLLAEAELKIKRLEEEIVRLKRSLKVREDMFFDMVLKEVARKNGGRNRE